MARFEWTAPFSDSSSFRPSFERCSIFKVWLTVSHLREGSILHMAVDPLPTAHPSGEMWANIDHPVSPDKLAFAVGAPGNIFNDHGMRWDNSGKNGHYAPIRWSNHS
jgi:hypothetical protein